MFHVPDVIIKSSEESCEEPTQFMVMGYEGDKGIVIYCLNGAWYGVFDYEMKTLSMYSEYCEGDNIPRGINDCNYKGTVYNVDFKLFQDGIDVYIENYYIKCIDTYPNPQSSAADRLNVKKMYEAVNLRNYHFNDFIEDDAHRFNKKQRFETLLLYINSGLNLIHYLQTFIPYIDEDEVLFLTKLLYNGNFDMFHVFGYKYLKRSTVMKNAGEDKLQKIVNKVKLMYINDENTESLITENYNDNIILEYIDKMNFENINTNLFVSNW